MKGYTKELKIALSAILAVVILYMGIQFLKGINMFKATNFYYVEFDNVGGLTLSSPVYADGYSVGIVSDIGYNYNSPGHVVVKITTDKAFRMPEGSCGEIVTEMLGTTKMNLLLSKQTTQLKSPGDTIYGRLNNGLMDSADAVMPYLIELLPHMDSLVCAAKQLLESPALNHTLQHTEALSATLTTTLTALNHLLGNEVPQLMAQLSTACTQFDALSQDLQAIDFDATAQELRRTLLALQSVTDALRRDDNTVGLLLADPSLYENLTATVATANGLLEDLQKHPKRYVHFSLIGGKEKTGKE